MKFTANKVLDPLEYDFAPYCDAAGSVPEPSDDQVVAYQHGLANAVGEATGAEVTNRDALIEALAALTEEQMRKIDEVMLDVHADVCGGSPSREHIATLPYRLKQAWYGYVAAWLSPEAWRPVTNG